MDTQTCIVGSIIATIGLLGLDGVMHSKAYALFLISALFSIQYGVIQIYKIFVYPQYFSPLRHLPGPKDNHPFFGQTLNIYKSRTPDELYLQWSRSFPDEPLIRYLEVGNKESIMLNSLKAFKDALLTNSYLLIKPASFRKILASIGGDGITLIEGQQHKVHRRFLNGPFSPANARKAYPLFQKMATSMTKHLADDIAASQDGTVQMESVFSKVILDAAGVSILGISFSDFASAAAAMSPYEAYERVLHPSTLGIIITFIDAIAPFSIRPFVPIEASMGLTRALEFLQGMVRTEIRKRMEEMSLAEKKGRNESEEGEGYVGRDILAFILDGRSRGENTFTEDEIVQHLLTFMVAALETAAIALTRGAYVLAKMPEIQIKLRAEAVKFLEQSPNPSPNDLERFDYLNQFIQELLRLHSPVIITFREAAEDVVIAGTHIPKGTAISVNLLVMNRSFEVWGADADTFRPERWEELAGSDKPCNNPHAFQTFYNGPRTCVGKHFALLELRVMFLELIMNFRLSSSPGQDLPDVLELPRMAWVRAPKDGLRLKMEKI